MWWIVLSLIIASIVVLLWWRNLQERSWQREMAYLTRHENHAEQKNTPANLQSSNSVEVESVITQSKNADPTENNQTKIDNQVFLAQENLQHQIDKPATTHYIHQENIELTNGNTEVTSPAIDAKIEPQITVTESAPISAKIPKELTSTTQPVFSSNVCMNVQSDTHPLETVDTIAPQTSRPVQQTELTMDNPRSELVIAEEVDEITQTDTEQQTPVIPLQRMVSSSSSVKVNENLSIITLEEATRKISAHTLTETEEAHDPAQLEVIQFNWRQKQMATRREQPKRRVNEIKPDDPMLNKVRSQTRAEQEKLLKVRALKNFNLDELEQATQHSLGQAVASPSHLANSVSLSNSIPVDQHQEKQIIDEEDIRLNLLRQRLARLRQQNNNRNVDSMYFAPVIAEEEVFSNLAKTDSPINKQRFKRPMVRESVIPAAARIGDQHVVQMNVPVADMSAEKAMNNIILDKHIPLSTRFTPFQSVTGTDTNTGIPSRTEYDSHSEDEHENTYIQSVASTRMDESRDSHTINPAKILSNQTVNDNKLVTTDQGLRPHDVSVHVHTSNLATNSAEQFIAAESDSVLNDPYFNDCTNKREENPLWLINDSPSEDFVSTNPHVINTEPPFSLNNLPFQYIEDTQEDNFTTVEPSWSSYNDGGNKQRVFPKSAAIAANIDQQLQQNAISVEVPYINADDANFSPDIAIRKSAAIVAEKFIKESKTGVGMELHKALHQPSTIVPTQKSFQPAMLLKPLLPGMDLLLPPHYDLAAQQSEETLLENGITIEEKLAEFKVKVKVIDAFAGPVITRYEIEPAQGVRGSQVVNLEKDLARSLGFASIRIVETIPGKTCMGIELPNPKRQIIRLSEIFSASVFQQSHSKLTLALGQGITGQPIVTDLAKAPHLLVAGTTGSGKSVGVNAMILSMLFKATPDDVRMIMIDPKMLELSIYEGIPHLLAPVVTDMKLAANALTWCVNEMEKRYRLMSHTGVRNLAGFNQKITEMAAQGRKLTNPFSLNPQDPEPLEKLPYIVVVVDEFADLMMTAGKKIEELIARLAQKARAAGIHLILATQRPSVDVITGLIKANIPTRLAFQVSSKVDSRTILDQMGAENLLGQGDMLFLPPGTAYPERVHGAFVADEEVHRVVNYLKQFGEPKYIDDILTAGFGEEDLFSNASARNSDNDHDPLYDDAVALVVKNRKASISSVQRHLRIGYNRAARLVEQMEADGVVSAPEGNGNRTVLVPQNNQFDG